MTLDFYRRNLPHWQPQQGAITIFLTWRLFGSLPKGFTQHLRRWKDDPRTQFLNADCLLDAASSGPVWLKDPEIAGCVERAIRCGAELGHYVLRAHVVMPNHVHVLLEPLVPLHKLMGGIKGASAREANLRLGRTGQPFWQDESFDHWIRDAGQFARTKAYIENNPAKARLCSKPEDWPWSSAHK
jgi:REP element-mobilizing transposase RayT